MKHLNHYLSVLRENAFLLNILALIIATLAIMRPQRHMVTFIGKTNDSIDIKGFVCREGMTSILLKNPETHMVHPNLIEALSQSGFEGVGEYKEVKTHAHMDSRGLCRLVLTFPEKRSFSVYITESAEAPFSFFVTDINETPLKDN